MKLLNSLYSIISQDETGNDTTRFVIQLNPEHIIYQAHFPGQPITPGVCILQVAAELAGEALGKELRVQGVKNMKFLSPISPIDTPELSVLINTAPDPAGLKVQASLQEEHTAFAKLSFTCLNL